MENFYLTLPSNVVNEQFDNTVSNYKTKLASRMILDETWEVGLAAISYTKSWYNLNKNEIFKLHYYDPVTKEPIEYRINPSLFAGNYDSIELLIARLNELMLNGMKHISNETSSYRTKRSLKLNPSEFNQIIVDVKSMNRIEFTLKYGINRRQAIRFINHNIKKKGLSIDQLSYDSIVISPQKSEDESEQVSNSNEENLNSNLANSQQS